MTGKAIVIRGNALHLPLPDESVDLIVTSPPYFALRSYRDEGEHYTGQIGSEPTPQEWLEALWACTSEWWRVLKPSGSVFVNLGDKRAGSGGHNNSGVSKSKASSSGLQGGPQFSHTAIALDAIPATRRNAPDRYNQAAFGRPKSRMALPERFMIGCMDGKADPEGIGWIYRQNLIWCLSGGVRVYARTPTGDRPIMLRDLYRSYRPEGVQLWNGEKWTQCLGWTQTPADRTALEIELRSGERIGCTRTHQWPTQRGLLRADQLTAGDTIANSTALPEPPEAVHAGLPDEDIGWFVGLYLAEGSRSETTIQIAGHRAETLRTERLRRIATAYDGTVHVYRTSENGITCNLRGAVLSGILDRYISRGLAATKRLTVHAWQRSDAFLAAVVKGYLDGDGHFDAKNNRWRLGFCMNDEWAADLRTLAARLGTKISLRRTVTRMDGRGFPGWRGEWRWESSPHWNTKAAGQIVAIRRSRAREFYDVAVADEPHLFALASGVLTHNSKLNGLPESVTDRHRDNFEFIYHFVKQERYFAAMDEIREGQKRFISGYNGAHRGRGNGDGSSKLGSGAFSRDGGFNAYREEQGVDYNPLGKLPGAVWPMASEPLIIPQWAIDKYNLPQHFAAFPQELPRKLILGFSPSGICLECGEGRRPVVDKRLDIDHEMQRGHVALRDGAEPDGNHRGMNGNAPVARSLATIIGYACACTPYTDHKGSGKDNNQPERVNGYDWEAWKEGPKGKWREYHLDRWTPPPTRPAVICDPFGGTGTVAMVAKQLGRIGISVDLSADYSRLAQWRIAHPPSKVMARTWQERQGSLL